MAGVPAGLLRMTRNLNKPPGLLQEIRISNRVAGGDGCPRMAKSLRYGRTGPLPSLG